MTYTSPMIFDQLQLPGVFIISPIRHKDARGIFSETFRLDKFSKTLGEGINFVQDNLVYSHKTGTLRGLHYQSAPHAQGKLVSCLSGRLTDVIVDIRNTSPTYGKHLSIELSAETGQQLWVPAGFAHGYITREPNTLVMYKVTDYYASECEGAIAYNDPDLAIDWGIEEKDIILSDKDKAAQSFASLKSTFK